MDYSERYYSVSQCSAGPSQWCCASQCWPLHQGLGANSTWLQCCCRGPDPSMFLVLHTRSQVLVSTLRTPLRSCWPILLLKSPPVFFQIFQVIYSISSSRDVKMSNQELWLSVLSCIAVSSCPVLWNSRMRGMRKRVMWLLCAWPFLHISKCTQFLCLLSKAGSEPPPSPFLLLFLSFLCCYVHVSSHVQKSVRVHRQCVMLSLLVLL